MLQMTLTNVIEGPKEGYTHVEYASNGQDLLIASSWNGQVLLYAPNQSSPWKATYTHPSSVLNCTLSPDASKAYSGGLDKSLVCYDYGCEVSTVMGTHDMPISALSYDAMHDTIITGSWDQSARVWDPRTHKTLMTLPLQGKCFSLSQYQHTLVIATSGARTLIYDTRRLSDPIQTRAAAFPSQTRRVCAFEEGYAESCVEGRVAITRIDANETTPFAFKCHRQKDGQDTTIFPVMSMAFHPIYGTLCTGGSDAKVYSWDINARKRLCGWPAYETSIVSLSYNTQGTHLAIAESYGYEKGALESMGPSKIHIRQVKDSEVMPKGK